MNFWLFVLPAFLLAAGALSALVSALETALLVTDAETRQFLRRHHPSTAKKIEGLLASGAPAQNCLFLADSFLNVILIALSLLLLSAMNFLTPAAGLPGWLLVAAALGALVVFCEVLPKLLALSRPGLILTMGSGVLCFLVQHLQPLSLRIRKWQEALQGVLSPAAPQTVDSGVRRAELMALLDIAGEEGVIFPEEASLMREIIRLGGEKAAHCMTPRVDAFTLPDDLSNEAAAALVRTRRYRRVPVHGETPDDILGVLDVAAFLRDPSVPYPLQLEPPAFIPDSMNALELLQNFLLGRRKFALLLDEYGGFEGLVTLSDLVDELVGGEGPYSGSGLYLEKVGPGRILASGNARLDDIRDALQVALPTTQADTLGGFLMELHGGIPRPGTRISTGGWSFEVRRSSRKRIKEVTMDKLSPETEFTP